MVPFALGEAWFAVDIRRVREIVRVPDMGRATSTVAYRGETVRLWQPPRAATGSHHGASVNNRILFFDLGDRTGALLVDRVGEVVRVDPSSVRAAGGEPTGFAPGVAVGEATVDGRRMALIDPHRPIASLPSPDSAIAA
jgi:chemotaxis signal transduction protein